ncbi:MAG TPA: nuclear transport factor 2 family protein [Solirubrobacterales bacterium]|nr:nuclear transport factor 2 family protein [Solirubrobacterales bacterium]
MYHAIVRRRATQVFDLLSRDWRRTIDGLSPYVHHVFPGEHPLGGERHTRDAVVHWFERLDRLFPGHDFTTHRTVSRGWPWNTWVAVQWSAVLRPQAGEPYTNHGAHWLHIRWGKVIGIYAYLDSQRVAEACATMAQAGIPEAAAPPIVD